MQSRLGRRRGHLLRHHRGGLGAWRFCSFNPLENPLEKPTMLIIMLMTWDGFYMFLYYVLYSYQVYDWIDVMYMNGKSLEIHHVPP